MYTNVLSCVLNCVSYQDLYLERLTQQSHELEEQLALYDAQASAQLQETRAVKEALTDASMELEVGGGGLHACTL